MKKLVLQALGLVAALAAVGCKDPSFWAAPQAETVPPASIPKFSPNSAAGVKIDPPTAGGKLWMDLLKSRAFSSRFDPFALQGKEVNYENSQAAERLSSENPWRLDVDLEEQPPVIPQVEAQPYRRLAGVIVGDSVLALIDMGDHQLQLIRPGQDINGWHVVSIDSEQAVLTRGGNKLPHQIIVRLEEPPPGGFAPGGGGGGARGGQPGAGNNPGGAPGAAPGMQGVGG
ncbi:MAG: hypothetical protein ACHQ50_02005 [Fimbriimonadales bacterium]